MRNLFESKLQERGDAKREAKLGDEEGLKLEKWKNK